MATVTVAADIWACACTEVMLEGVTVGVMVRPPPLGSRAGRSPAALALRSLLPLAVRGLSIWLIWFCQLCTSVALAPVCCEGSVPPVVADGLATAMSVQ